jgi:hypothetical protein
MNLRQALRLDQSIDDNLVQRTGVVNSIYSLTDVLKEYLVYKALPDYFALFL